MYKQDYSAGLVLLSQIVRHGSLSATAQHLGLGRAAVSKQLSSLEKKIGARLLQRTTRTLSLTEVGREVLAEARKVEQALLSVESISDSHQQQISGKLRVSSSSAIGRTHLLPLLKPFTEQYPHVDISLQLEDRFVDLVSEQVDVCIRIGHLNDSSLIARKLGQLHWQVCASPAYLKQHGTPQTPSDLLQHQCLYYRNSKSSMETWGFTNPNGEEERITVSGPLAINDATALIAAAVNGMGILNIDNAIISEDVEQGRLIKILQNYKPLSGLPVYVVYPAKDFIPARTRAFIDFLLTYMAPKI